MHVEDSLPGHTLSRMRWHYIVVWMMIMHFALLTVEQEVVSSPNDTTVFPNQSAVFPCEVNGVYTFWRVNGTPSNEFPYEIRSDLVTKQGSVGDNELYTLTIPGKDEYNETRVQCVTGRDGVEVESETVTLRVQGILAPVGDLKIDNSSISSIIFSWGAPFSLDVTDVDPDIWYTVLIYNVTDQENPTTIPCTDCHNLTQTHYIFSPDHPSPCHQYTFTVIPFNGAGQGESSQPVAGYTIDEKINIRCDRIDIKFIDGVLHVTFNVSGNDRRVCGYTLRDVDSDTSLDSGVLLSDKSVLLFIVDLNKKYELEVSNAAGLMNTPHTIFTSFDVQNITVQSMGTEVNITGVFISNSQALGCFVVLQCNENNPDHFRVLLRNQSQNSVSSIIDAPSKEDTEYTIFVYDLEEKGLPYERPAIARGDKVFVNAKDPIRSVSIFLKRAELSRDGSEVTIRCEFVAEYPEASCVLIYREYNKTKLTVIEYDHSTVFPVSENVPNSERYTFAVFGKNGVEKVEEEPVLTLREETYMTYQSPDEDDPESISSSSGKIVAIITVMIVLSIAVLVGIASAVNLRWRMNKRRMRQISHGMNVTGVAIRPDGVSQSEVVVDMEEKSSTTTEKKEEGKKESKYTSVVTHNPQGAKPPPSVEQPVQYQTVDLKATKRRAHPQGLHYTEVAPPPPDSQGSGRNWILDEPPTKYATILPHIPLPADGPRTVEDKKSKESQLQKSEARGPPTVEAVMSLLWSVAIHWRAIAEGLGFDEDHIEEIFTNNETDGACLQDCVEQWMRLGPTWKKLALVLSDVGEDSLAQQAGGRNDVGGSHSQNTSKWETFQEEDDDDESFQSMSEETSQSGDGQFVTENLTQTQNTSKDDETRGFKVAMSKEHSAEQHGDVVVTQSNVLQEESPIDDITDNMYLSEEENGNTETEPTSSVECSSDHEDAVALVMYGGTTHHISTLHLTSSGCFETPPPSFQCYCDCDNADVVTTADDDHDQYSNPTEMEACQQETDINLDVMSIVCRSFSKPQKTTKAGCRKVYSDTGPIAVIPQPCTEVQTGEAAINRAQYGGAVFNCKIEGQDFEEFTSVKKGLPATLSTKQKRKLIVVPLTYLLDDDGMVTGGMYSNPYYVDCSKMRASFVTVGRPVLNYARAKKPSRVEDTQPQRPPEANPPQKPPENFERGQLSKVNPPFKKRQWSDPPENYQEKMQKWTHTGIALGFHGPDNLIIIDGNSHYG